MEPLDSVEETPAKTRKISGARDIYSTPQPMEMCTPLVTKPNIKIVNMGLNQVNYLGLEMEVTPCVKINPKLNKNRANQCLAYSAVKPKTSLEESIRSMEVTSELEYSLLEAEEMFKNASLKTERIINYPILNNLHQNSEDPTNWVFFENVLKGFNDPQL